MFLGVAFLSVIPILFLIGFLIKYRNDVQDINYKGIIAFIALAFFVVPMFNLLVLHALADVKSADTEILNGKVLGKHRETVSCEHSYSCHPHQVCTGSGSSKYCTTEYDTCYEHDHDYDWIVSTSIKDINIERVDSQGTIEPDRFEKVQSGEPASFKHMYMNYIKGNENSLFNKNIQSKYPELPEDSIYDYYRYNHVIVDGIKYNPNILNNILGNGNAKIGASKQVNIKLILTNKPQDFAIVTQNRWLGGKKNEINVFIGTDGSSIKWVYVFSWSSDKLVNTQMQSDILVLGKMDDTKIGNIIVDDTTKYFKRQPMKKFEYLSEEYHNISLLQFTITTFLGTMIVFWTSLLILALTANKRRYYYGNHH